MERLITERKGKWYEACQAHAQIQHGLMLTSRSALWMAGLSLIQLNLPVQAESLAIKGEAFGISKPRKLKAGPKV